MKNTLDLEELAFRDQGRHDPRFKTFKKHLMANTYDNLRDMFEDLADLNLIEETEYEEDLKFGYKDTESGGSGFLNTKGLNTFLKKQNPSTE